MLPGHGLLGAAKAALEASVRYLALELADRHVTAVGIAPGPVDTDSFRVYGGSQWDDYNAEWTARTPLGHIATAEDLAPVLEFLLSPAAAWFNGHTLVADGGLSLATMAPSLAAGARR
jgi:enoyl-[acyl-carrier protein] reductase III